MQRVCSNANLKPMKCAIVSAKINIPSLLGVLLFFPCLLQAASLNTDLLSQISRDSGTDFFEDMNSMQQAAGPLVDSVGVTAAGASASASLDIDYGLIRTQASGYLNYSGAGYDYVEVTANGLSRDVVTINGGVGTLGTLGTLTAQVFLTGSGNASSPVVQDPGFDEVIASYSVGLSNLYGYGGTSAGGGWTSTSEGYVGDPLDPLGQVYDLTTWFIFGTPWELGLYSYLHVSISPLTSAGIYQGDIDLSNTITWLGIQSITDESGNPIGSFTINSESGFDWSNAHPSAIPIPAAFWLFGSGLIGLIGITRRKKL